MKQICHPRPLPVKQSKQGFNIVNRATMLCAGARARFSIDVRRTRGQKSLQVFLGDRRRVRRRLHSASCWLASTCRIGGKRSVTIQSYPSPPS